MSLGRKKKKRKNVTGPRKTLKIRIAFLWWKITEVLAVGVV